MNKDATLALKALMNGNDRFVSGKMLHGERHALKYQEMTDSQHPLALVLSCSDSRVPPEIIFDQGIGDLFVVRVAGNVLSESVLGSIEYAAEHVGSQLLVVLGHTRCGAVTAAVKGGAFPGHISAITQAIAPAVAEAGSCCAERDLVEVACEIHVKRVLGELAASSPILSGLIAAGRLTLIGAIYDLETGRVRLLEEETIGP